MRRLSLFVAALVSAVASLTALAEPQVVTHYKHYTINPANLADLPLEINRRTPVEQDGAKYHGLARWNVNWRLSWTPLSSGCRLSSVQTGVEIEYTMPQLGQADEETRKRFDAYYAALKVHEDGHGRHGVLAAREIEVTLAALPAYPSCGELERASNQIAYDIVRRYNKSDIDYDALTQHGATQGALLHIEPGVESIRVSALDE